MSKKVFQNFIEFIMVSTLIIPLLSLITSCTCNKPEKLDANDVSMNFLIDGKMVKDAKDMAGEPDPTDQEWIISLEIGKEYLIEDANMNLKNLSRRDWYQVTIDEVEEQIGVAEKFQFKSYKEGKYKLRLCYNKDKSKCTDRWINIFNNRDQQYINEEQAIEQEKSIQASSNTTDLVASNFKYSKKNDSKSYYSDSKKEIIQNTKGNASISPNEISNQNDIQKKSQLDDQQKIEDIRKIEEHRKEEEQRKAQEENKVNRSPVVETPKVEEKVITSTPKFTKEGTTLQVQKESCITTQGHPIGGGSMKLAASIPIRLRGASVYSNREGRCKFTLSGPQGQRGTKTTSLNAGVNAIRFSEWPHLILNSGETWILEFEGQGGVELYELNECVKTNNSELRPMNKMFLFNLNYYN